MHFQHKTLIRFSGIVWLLMGLFLLRRGILFLMSGLHDPNVSLLPFLTSWLGVAESGVALLVIIGLAIGYIKGKTVLKKSAYRVMNRLRTMPEPLPLHQLYHWSFYLLIGGMIGLGIMMNVLGMPVDLRGTILIAIGAALLNGSVFYFKGAYE
jgi:hypothetical protein